MFLSKIWFFLIAVAGGVALAIALILPQPAEREQLASERQRLATACDVVNILLRDNARRRVDLAAQFARSEIDISSIVKKPVSADSNKAGRPAAANLIASTKGAIKPRFTFLLNSRGRVVARAGRKDELYGDSLAGHDMVADAVDGYLRDDLWVLDNNLYLMAGSPVIGSSYVGALVVGHDLDDELARRFVAQLGVELNFYADGKSAAASNVSSAASVHKEMLARFQEVRDADTPIAEDCRSVEPFTVEVSTGTYTALVARLPGEAGLHHDAFYGVYAEQPQALGVMGTLRSATSSDLSFSNFPWITLLLGFIVVVAVGMALMIFETDRPLGKLNTEAISLAKGDRARLDEDAHRGKFGSIARSFNIRVDKMEREAKEAKNKGNLDDLLGPAPPVGSSPALSVPAIKPPPPSAFRFSDSNPRLPAYQDSAGGVGGAPGSSPGPGSPPRATPNISVSSSGITPPPPLPGMDSSSDSVPVSTTSRPEISALGSHDRKSSLVANGSEADDGVFQTVFEQFLDLKTECGESVASLTFERFAKKLRSNRDALMAKHSCTEVRFQVYVKDGKAALKATPIKT